MSRKVIGLLGLAGAGKTSAADALTEQDSSFVKVEMSTIAGNVYDEVDKEGLSYFSDSFVEKADQNGVQEDVLSMPSVLKVDELGDWVDAVLDVNERFFAEKLIEYILSETAQDSTILVDGVRTNADVSVLKDSGFQFELVCIYSPFHVRLERLQERGRGSEKDMSPEDLIYRDEQELSWGLDEILTTERAEYFYNNYDSLEKFQSEFEKFVEGVV